MLDGDNTLSSELLDLVGTVLLPVQDVSVLADAQGATSEDNSTDVILEASSADSLLVGGGGTGLFGQNEAGTDPDGGGTEHEGSSDGVAVEQTTGSDDLHGLAGQRALVALDQLGNGRDEDSSGDITGVAATLTTLGADDIDTDVEGLLDVLGVADHVHAEDTGTVELLDNGLGGNTDGGDEKLGTTLNDNVDELVELAFGVVVAEGGGVSLAWWSFCVHKRTGVCLLGLASTAANLGEEQVDTEGSVLIIQVALQLGDLLPEHIRSVTNTTDNTQTTGVGDRSRQLRASGHVHTSQQNRVVDLQQIGDGSADDLCGDDTVSTCLEGETKRNGKTVEQLTRGSHDAMRCDARLEGWRK